MTETSSRARVLPPGPGPDPHASRTRRRFVRRQWRRRWLRWRLVLAAGLVLALGAGAVWAVYFSSLLAVEEVEVTGESTLSAEAVLEAARVPLGGPLASADLRAAQLRVGSLAMVRSVEVTRQWPNTVVVEVEERTPIAVVAVGDQLRGLDEDGRVLPAVPGGADALPRVVSDGDASADALAEAAHVVASMSSVLAAQVDHVEVETVDQITLELRDGRDVRWGSAAQSQEKADVLAALLQQPPAREYDVSVPGLPTSRG